jgi:DNA-binding transcriptional LysR family regulator
MNFHSLDLNLLVVFDALMRARSVTQAGEKLGLSQSSTSNALQRLRTAFADPLFVRTPKGMEPTVLALELEMPMRTALDQLKAVVEKGQTFDPATAVRTFKILMSDIAQTVHLPGLISMLRSDAPSVRLENVALPIREAKQSMTAGELDLAVGFLPDLGADFHRQSLFAETWVCVVSKKHSVLGESISSDEYLRATHVSYRPSVAIHSVLDQLLESQFASKGMRRVIGLVVPYSSGLASTVEACDLILTVPVGLATSMANSADLRILSLPFELPRIDLNMQWHERVHRDAGGRWFRSAVANSYRSKTAL